MNTELVGNADQLGYIRRSVLSEGNGAGMEIVDVRSGGGIDVTILPQRGLDVGDVFYNGRCLTFMTPNGLTHPNRYDPYGLGWLWTFPGGLLTTCGLSYLGPPGEDDGEILGLHGRYTSLAASSVWTRTARGMGDGQRADASIERVHSVGGTVEECSLFGRRLRMERRIDVYGHRPKIVITDTVTNYGFEASPFAILYHMNLGFPLLAPGGKLYVSSRLTHAHSDSAEPVLDSWDLMREPEAGIEEELFLHEIRGDADGFGHAVLADPGGNLALHISFPQAALPLVTQWKLMKSGEYALGVEPSNVPVMTRSDLRNHGLLPELEAGANWRAAIEVEVCDGPAEVERVLSETGLTESEPPTTAARYGA